jgi:hypothetical protein
MGQQQLAAGCRIFARKGREFGVEILEAQVDAEPGGVFAQDGARLVELLRRG